MRRKVAGAGCGVVLEHLDIDYVLFAVDLIFNFTVQLLVLNLSKDGAMPVPRPGPAAPTD